MKKSLSILLVAALTVTAVISMPLYPSAAAGAGGDPGNVRAVTYGSCSSVNMLIYNDELFTTDPTVYDPQLAAMTIALASASCNSERVDQSTKYSLMSRNAYEFLEDNGFTDIYVNDDYKVKPDGTKAPAIFGHKKIKDKGREYTLLALVPKSGAMGAEFYPVANASHKRNDEGDFAYNSDLRDKVLESAREYIRNSGIKGDLKVWVPGYSRGGGVAVLIAADIIDDPQAALGKDVSVSDSDIYCYSLSSYKTAVDTRDLQADRYMAIHNIISESDIVINLPWEDMSFGWIGNVHKVRSLADRDEALRLLSINSPGDYRSYLNGSDPDAFSPMKLNIRALLDGKLSMEEDDASYIPDDQGEYIDSVMAPIIEMFGEKGGSAREGYYMNYQEAMTRFITYYKQYGLPDSSVLLGSKTAVPFILSAYITSLFEAGSKNSRINNAELSAAAEDAFNALAYIIEDGQGNLRIGTDAKRLKTFETAYMLFRSAYFSENSEPETNKLGIPQKYSLRTELRFDRLPVGTLRMLTAKLYSMTLKDVLTAQGVESETISQMTGDKDSAAMSAVITHVMFINDAQSGKIRPLSPENEQFKQLATFIGNYGRVDTLHYVEVDMSWIEGGSELFADFEGVTDDQFAGYRRVYINSAGQADVSGTVKDESGNTVASFKNGRMLSRTDEWIGYTVSDNGGWLRLPLTHSYTVEMKTSKDTVLDLKLAEYSVHEGKELRSARWKDLHAYKNGSVVLSVPEIAAGESGYTLPSDVKYDVSVSGSSSEGPAPAPAENTVYSKSVPKAKSVSVKSGSGSMTVRWKKLRASDRKKFSKVEVQYSTSKKFKTYKTLDVSKNKKSVRIKGLKKGKTYYVRVRNVKKKGGIKYVSKWSVKKKAKVR